MITELSATPQVYIVDDTRFVETGPARHTSFLILARRVLRRPAPKLPGGALSRQNRADLRGLIPNRHLVNDRSCFRWRGSVRGIRDFGLLCSKIRTFSGLRGW